MVKFRASGQGARALVAELIAGEIGRVLVLVLNVPEIVVMRVDGELARTEPDAEIQALIKASIGVNVALEYLPGSVTFDPLVRPPVAELSPKVVWFDALCANVDRTVKNVNMLMWHRRLWLIDHGAALYMHHDWDTALGRSRDPFARVRDHVLLPFAAPAWGDRRQALGVPRRRAGARHIRGGSEYGPAWHQVALKENRQRAFDDFIAVSEHLISTGVTSPAKLGAIGRSNGGLLMGVVMTQRPELYAAMVNGVPLFDMQRLKQIGAGASWVGDYGDPETGDWQKFLAAYSPLHNPRKGQPYPKIFLYTATADDRMHPAHARKAGARLRELGYDFFYYENMDGGHSGAANQQQLAYRVALEYAYFARMLMPLAGVD